MTSKQRVFSNSTDIMPYTDYIKNKNALVTLSTIKHATNFVQNYKNYDDFISQSKMYSKYLTCDEKCYTPNCTQEYTTNLYNANSSYINSRIKNKHAPHACNIDLYPYGINYSKKPCNIKLNSKLYLDKWVPCNNPCILSVINCECTITKNHNRAMLIKSNNCKTGLCKNAKPLFL